MFTGLLLVDLANVLLLLTISVVSDAPAEEEGKAAKDAPESAV